MRNKIFFALAVFLAVLFVRNSARLSDARTGRVSLIAHRGVSQPFDMNNFTAEPDTSKRIFPSKHDFIENTIPSIDAAFKAGADIVEIDIQQTKDNRMVLFQDSMLEYRTNAKGSVRNFTFAEIRKLDAGYGFSADGGRTFPLRGKGENLIPSLEEVLDKFNGKEFLIRVANDDPLDGEIIAKILSRYNPKVAGNLTINGSPQTVDYLKTKFPGLRVMSEPGLKKNLISYIALGWSGYIPKSCRNTQVHIPLKYSFLLWGWPNLYLERMERVNTRVVLVPGEAASSRGFDTAEDLKQIPYGYDGYILTNRIEVIGPMIKK